MTPDSSVVDFRARLGAVLELVTLFATGAILVCRFATTTEAAVDGMLLWIPELAFLATFLWLLARYAIGSLGIRWTAVDLATLLLVAGHAIGALVVFVWDGDRRAALNLLFEWLGVGATVFLMSRLIPSLPQARQSFVAIFVALAAGTGLLGIWQHHYGYKEMAALYRTKETQRLRLERSPAKNDPRWTQEMATLESWYVANQIPLDEGARKVWEQRALHSQEPYGLFSLANTFAGLLAPGLLLTLGWLRLGRRGSAAWFVALLVAMVIGYCLLLTKSRTAWLGLLVGGAVWMWLVMGDLRSRANQSRRRSLWLPIAGMILIAATIVTAVASGSLDRFVLSEAGKSLRYRGEWWTATWQMQTAELKRIAFGVGLGNFRQHYLSYKLPQSSEEIRDPHNLVLDAWSNGGLVAVGGLVVLLVSVGASARPVQTSQETGAHGQRLEDAERTPLWLEPALGSVLAGLGAVFVLGGEGEQLAPVCLVASVVCLTARRQPVDRCSIVGAAVALTVHLLGAGGLGMPAVTQLLLGLVALLTVRDQASGIRDQEAGFEESPVWSYALTATVTGILIGGGMWNLHVVQSASIELSKGDDALYRLRQQRAADQAYARAAAADPYGSEAWQRKALVAFSLSQLGLSREPAKVAFGEAVRAQQEALARDPRSHTAARALGQMYRRRYQQTKDRADAAEAVRWMGRAVALYPTRATLQAELAESAGLVESTPESREAARRALELHEINVKAGHPDKQLSVDVVRRMQTLVEPP